MALAKFQTINREVSWLLFNERVLQEAKDPSVPLIERLRFLGIFSNNRDEFFRVRVATLRRMQDLGKKEKKVLNFSPSEVLEQIEEVVLHQERMFSKIYSSLKKELGQHDIHIINEKKLTSSQQEKVEEYFSDEIRGALVPVMLSKQNTSELLLRDTAIYLAVKLSRKKGGALYSVVEIPSVLPRFTVLPGEGGQKYVILLDDIIRHNLSKIYNVFDFESIDAHTFKITRDAELDIEEGIQESWIEKLSRSVRNRKDGDTVRFVYDSDMPKDVLRVIKNKLGIEEEDTVVPGGRYHNFKDFMKFPDVGAKHLRHKKLRPLDHPVLKSSTSIMDSVLKEDILLHYPYQTFNYIIDLLRESAIDPKVKSIKINLYRVAPKSKVINALINAARNGKKVEVILELTARFDEKNNIRWSERLAEHGIDIIHGVPGLKVHSKLVLIEREERGKLTRVAHIGTGNFHEGTAMLYGDITLLTAHEGITNEVAKIFEFFQANYKRSTYRHLVVSPFNVRRRLGLLIDNEIRNAKKGKKAEIILKVNNLVDEQLIRQLYEASEEGVKIRMMVRGICALIPGVKGMSSNIEAYSIVDRFLEHARVIKFHNDGDAIFLLGSADLMTRNLDRRVEVMVRVYDNKLQKELDETLEIQFKDNVKRRMIDGKLTNKYVPTEGAEFRAQIETYKYYKSILKR